ncbi:hypothetical protein Plhal304r1_c007g0028811 [Plasmopara halstedii]
MELKYGSRCNLRMAIGTKNAVSNYDDEAIRTEIFQFIRLSLRAASRVKAAISTLLKRIYITDQASMSAATLFVTQSLFFWLDLEGNSTD